MKSCNNDCSISFELERNMTWMHKRNNITVIGTGRQTMLFAHGFGCDQNAWKYIKNAFARDYTLVLFDYIGAGGSDPGAWDPEKYATLDGWADDVLEICRALQLNDVIFVGHSVSCMIGALAAIQQPGLFKKLIFIGPSPCYINKGDYVGGFSQEAIDSLLEVMEEDYISWSISLAPVIIHPDNGEALTQELTDSFCAIDDVIARQFAKVTFLSDNRKELPLIPVDSLTIQCSEDSIAPLVVGQYIYANTPGNILTVLEAFGHCPHMSHPEKTISAMVAYLGLNN